MAGIKNERVDYSKTVMTFSPLNAEEDGADTLIAFDQIGLPVLYPR